MATRPLCVGFSSATRVARFQLGNLEVSFKDATGKSCVFVLSEETLRLVDLNLERWRREEHEARLLTMNEGRLGVTLVQAAGGGGVRDTTFLLSHGADINYQHQYMTPFTSAARNGHLTVATVLLDAGAAGLRLAFKIASSWGQTPMVALLLDRGADIHDDGDEALRVSAFRGQLETTQLLLDRGADVHAQNDLALRLCVRHRNRLEMVRFLLDRGADVHAQGDEALRDVAEKGKPEMARMLLDRGADVHAGGDLALYLAARRGHLQMVRLLLDRGAYFLRPPGVYPHQGCLALNAARSNAHYEVVALLMERGARAT